MSGGTVGEVGAPGLLVGGSPLRGWSGGFVGAPGLLVGGFPSSLMLSLVICETVINDLLILLVDERYPNPIPFLFLRYPCPQQLELLPFLLLQFTMPWTFLGRIFGILMTNYQLQIFCLPFWIE